MEGVIAVFIPIAFFLVAGAIVFLALYFHFRNRREAQITVRTAIEQGQELSPEVLEAIKPKTAERSKDADLRRGVVLIACGLGIGAFGVILGEQDAVRPLLGIGAAPFLVGLAFLCLWLFHKRYAD